MNVQNNLLELRKKRKSRKPNFVRQDGLKKARLEKVWRKPRGRHSKQRVKKRGHPKIPSLGYRSPRAVYALHPTGLKSVMVSHINDLSKIKKDEGVVLLGKMGINKKLKILKKIQELKLHLLNADIDDFIKKLQEKITKKAELKKEKLAKKQKKEAKKKEVEKSSETKKEEKKEETPEEKEKREKEEKRKVLEKRQ